MRHASTPSRPTALIALVVLTTCLGGVFGGSRPVVRAASITVAYAQGFPDVSVNDYRSRGLGTFVLTDGSDDRVALCIEADAPHAATPDAYQRVPSALVSPQLDTLIWLVTRHSPVDDDTAVAAAALAWYYAGATRSIGVPVWADGGRGFGAVSPTEPTPWDALPRFSGGHPVGLRSGTTDLDAAERRLLELHREVQAAVGPWRLAAEGRRFRLTGPSGPIPGQAVVVTFGAAEPVRLLSDADGYVDPAIPELPMGGVARAVVDAPGPRQEWDGAGRVQGMITATSSRLEASFDVPAHPRHIGIVKRSADPAIGVAGGVFALVDIRGSLIDTVITDASGSATFRPFDPVAQPSPYRIDELEAPPGLERAAAVVIDGGPATDARHPTVVEIVDQPVLTPLVVRTHLSIDGVGPPDRSGFSFLAARRSDGRSFELTTGADGVTAVVGLPIGTYDVCERSVPPWASSLVDGGCRGIVIPAGRVGEPASDEPLVVEYVDLVPPPTITTRARTDGPRSVIDRVGVSALIPHTEYTVVGEVVDRGGHPVGAGAQDVFVADAGEHELELRFQLPDHVVGDLVVTERILVGGQELVRHDDLTDVDQTVTVIAGTSTRTSTSVAATATAVTITATTTIPTDEPIPTSSPILPATGGDAAALLHLGDMGFVVGVGLMLLCSLLPDRRRCAPTRP